MFEMKRMWNLYTNVRSQGIVSPIHSHIYIVVCYSFTESVISRTLHMIWIDSIFMWYFSNERTENFQFSNRIKNQLK